MKGLNTPMFADDIAVIADSEEGLQHILEIVYLIMKNEYNIK